MKYVRQLFVIMVIVFIGEMCNRLLPLPIPASIYGLLILFFGLLTGLIKLEWVKETGKFLISIMTVMFIPSAVGLLESWGILKPIFVPVVGITLITTVVIMVVSGKVTQFIIRKEKEGHLKEKMSSEVKIHE